MILDLGHMRSCMTVFDKALNTKFYELEVLTDDDPERIALLTIITTDDDVSKMDGTANFFR